MVLVRCFGDGEIGGIELERAARALNASQPVVAPRVPVINVMEPSTGHDRQECRSGGTNGCVGIANSPCSSQICQCFSLGDRCRLELFRFSSRVPASDFQPQHHNAPKIKINYTT